MTVRELINDLQTHFADAMDCEVRIAERGRGDKIAARPMRFTFNYTGDDFVSIFVKDSPSYNHFWKGE